MTAHQLVFVGGLHRSGTTPLARALAAHSDISGLSGTGAREDEGQHLQQVYPKAKVYGGSGRFARAAEAHLTESSPLATPDAAQRLREAWDPYWDLSKTYLVEKSPPNLIMGRFLQHVFPGSALIVVVRHPVVVALSNKKWRKLLSRDLTRYTTLSSMVDHWVRAHQTLREDAPLLQRLHVLCYEDLVSDPEQELAKIQQFLGLDQPIPAGHLRGDRSTIYERRWQALASPLRPGSVQRRLIERRFGPQIADFGYDVADLRVRNSASLLGSA
ncbi:MAG TPA: sulfotransferase [Dermatophilaceae bacterium]|nr:sulfotransferase [Dermatophilaceae bacterium]